jgi:predicted NAD-dependent protein-ADP-ribosyltransferase YbiA (DUF1768 family)
MKNLCVKQMASKVILLYNPSEKPYGPLSNNYRQEFEVRTTELVEIPEKAGKIEKARLEKKKLEQIYRDTWPAVTNYIYGMMLTDPSHRTGIKSSNPDEVLDKFKKFYVEEYKTILHRSYATAYATLLRQVPTIAEFLLATGKAKILYLSGNPIIGVEEQANIQYIDTKNVTNILDQATAEYIDLFSSKNSPYITVDQVNYYGDNMIGEILMQLRTNLELLRNQEKSKENILSIQQMLRVRNALEKKILLNNDLLFYTGKTYADLDAMLASQKQEYIPSEEQLRKMLRQGNIPYLNELADPCLLIMRLRQVLAKQQTDTRNLHILDMYAEYILEKNYSDIRPDQRTEARKQQIIKMNISQRVDLANKLYKLYEDGMLSSRLSDEIEKYIKTYNIIDTSNDAEVIGSLCEKPIIPDIPISDQTVIKFAAENSDEFSKKFSPIVYHDRMIVIDSLKYPTIAHYILSLLINQQTLSNSYSLLFKFGKIRDKPKSIDFLAIDDLNETYGTIKDNYLEKNLMNLAVLSLNSKFKDRNLQNILLYTNDSKLVWNDHEDYYLGNGTKELHGKNIVGKILERIRDKIIVSRQEEKSLGDLSQGDIDNLFSIKDPDSNFLKDWLRMRLKDVCTVLTIMERYSDTKNIQTKNEKFIENVFYGIYHPCDIIYNSAENIKIGKPSVEFTKLIGNIRGFCADIEKSEDLVKVVWKYLVTILYYLNSQGNTSSIDISKEIAQAEFLVSKNRKCISMYGNQQDDCKASALLNVICSLVNFQKKMGIKNITIESTEINTAVAIILCTPIKLEKEAVLLESPDEEEYVQEEGEGEEGGEEGGDDEDYEKYAESLEESLLEQQEKEDIGYSPQKYTSTVLENMPVECRKYILDTSKFLELFDSGIQALKQARGDRDVINNRINFFSSW